MHDKQMIEENEQLLSDYPADKFCGFHTSDDLFKQHGITPELANKIGGKIFLFPIRCLKVWMIIVKTL